MELAAATSKRARGGGGDPDRLSALPDCLLHVIMSSLKARQVVQTCVLSARWRDLWRSVPCLDVDLNEFRAQKPAAPDFEQEPEHDPGFVGGDHNAEHDPGFVGGDHNAGSSGEDSADSDDDISGPDDEISDSNEDISGLDNESSDSDDEDRSSSSSSDDDDDSSSSSSSSSDDDDSSSSSSSSSSDDENYYVGNRDKEWEAFEDFTANLMRRCNIAQLDSFRLHIGKHRAPRFGYRQASGWLRRALKYCTPHPASQRGGLSSGSWRLKRLHLSFVFLDSRFGNHVSSVCRSLEDLELRYCVCKIQSVTSHSLKTLVLKNCECRHLSEITAPSLKTLVIDGCSNSEGCKMVILTPAVTYLHLAVSVFFFSGGISTNEMTSLAKASIHLQGHIDSVFESNNLCGDQLKLLKCVSNVTSLEFSGVGKTVLGKEPRFQEFMNLRNLLLGKCDLRDDFRTLGFFLQSSPNLEKLTLRRCKFPKYPKEKKGKPKLNKTSPCEFRGLDFMCENLKVEIIYKDGDGHQLVNLLLRAAGNLLKNHIKLTKVN